MQKWIFLNNVILLLKCCSFTLNRASIWPTFYQILALETTETDKLTCKHNHEETQKTQTNRITVKPTPPSKKRRAASSKVDQELVVWMCLLASHSKKDGKMKMQPNHWPLRWVLQQSGVFELTQCKHGWHHRICSKVKRGVGTIASLQCLCISSSG